MLEQLAALVIAANPGSPALDRSYVGPSSNPGPPAMDRGYVSYLGGLYANETQGALFSSISARVLLSHLLGVEADIPFVGLGENDTTEFALGNVGLRILGRARLDEGSESPLIEGGLGLAIGSSEANTPLKRSALAVGNAMTGLRLGHQLRANVAAVYIPARIESIYLYDVFVKAEGLIGVVFPTGEAGGSAAVQITALGGVGKRWTLWEASLSLGVGTLLPTASSVPAEAQIALVPKVRLYSDPLIFERGGVFVEGSGNINLDEPHGFGASDGIVWGFFLEVGYLFPDYL